jgi:hypothetical protein
MVGAAFPGPSLIAPMSPLVATTSSPWTQKVADRTVDKKFLMLFGISAALAVNDIELTQHQPGRNAWMISPIATSTAHGVGAITGVKK